MQDKQQFDQLMLQYNQLKNGSEEIHHLIQKEDFDTAMTMLKSREALFLNCKCMRKYLELTPDQEQELNTLLEEIIKQYKQIRNQFLYLMKLVPFSFLLTKLIFLGI